MIGDKRKYGMSSPNKIDRRTALRRLGASGIALTTLTSPVTALGSSGQNPDGPSTDDNASAPGGGSDAAETEANRASDEVHVSRCESYKSSVSLGVHYYGSDTSPSGDKWLHEFCISGSSNARIESRECGDLEKYNAIDYQQFKVTNNTSADTILSAAEPDPHYRGVTPTPPNSSSSDPGYSDTVETVLKTAISYQYPTASYALTASELASAAYNDLQRISDSNDGDSATVKQTYNYPDSGNPNFPPADAHNYYRFYVSSDNSYYIDVTAEQTIGGPPMNSSSLSTSLRFSNDTTSSITSTEDTQVLEKGMSTQEVVSRFPSKRKKRTSLPDESPVREHFDSENIIRVQLPFTFKDPEANDKQGFN